MTQNDFLPFSKPYLNRAAIDEVVACLESGWITTGPRVQQFENMLKDYLQAPHVLALSTATAGLHLSLLHLQLKPGDEVITSSMTFVATLNAIVLAGGKPVLVDVDPQTYQMDMQQLEAAITPRTRALMPVHFTGLPVDLDLIYKLAEQHGLRVIEDAAQAIGSEYKGKRIGSFGDTQVFSFHPNKVITTGEGGCIATQDLALANSVKVQRFHGIDREAWNRFSKTGSQHYDVIAPGYKYNMMDMQAALGIHQLPELENIVLQRTELANRYLTAFKDWPELSLPPIPRYAHRHCWYIFAPLVNPEAAGMDRDTFMARMKEANIGTGLHYEAAHLYHYYRETFGFKPGDFPHAEIIGERIVSLPLFPGMTRADQDRVIDTMFSIFRQ